MTEDLRKSIQEAAKEICALYNINTPMYKRYFHPGQKVIEDIIEKRIVEDISPLKVLKD